MRALAAVMTAALLGTVACRARPAPATKASTAPVRVWEVYKDGRDVLTVKDQPGPVVSTAILPPGVQPSTNPFLSASAHDPEEEDALGRLLGQSKSLDDFLSRLRQAGYDVRPAPAE